MEENKEEKEEKKDIKIVSGDGSNLDITPVYNHITGEKYQTHKDKPKNIVIPKSNSKKSDDSKNSEDDTKEEEMQ